MNSGMIHSKRIKVQTFSALVVLAFLVLSVSGKARAEEEIRAARIAPIAADVLDDQKSDEVIFEFDSRQADQAATIEIDFEQLRQESIAMQGEVYKNSLLSTVNIPLSIEKAEFLKGVKRYSPQELKKFIARKTKYLESVAKVLSIFQVPSSAINKVLSTLNRELFRRSDVVVRSDTMSIAVGVGFSAGLALPDWLMQNLRKSPLFKGLPERVGFYVGFSTGIALVRTVRDGKNRLRFEPFLEVRRAERILGPIVSIGTGVFAGAGIEAHDDREMQTGRFFSAYRFGVSSTEKRIGVGVGLLGASFPPMGGRFAVLEGTSTGFLANAEGVQKLFKYVHEKAWRKQRSECAKLFAVH